MTALECPFCRKLADLAELTPGEVVWSFPHSVALLGPWQYYHGYCILVSRTHATELNHLPEEQRRAYLDELCLLAGAVEGVFRPGKLNYELLGNQVPHLHWHLFPRYREDPGAQTSVWVTLSRAEHDHELRVLLETGPEERATTIGRLRERLVEMGAPGL